MRNLVLGLLLFGFISSGHSQILLEETKVDYRPETLELDPVSNTLVLQIPEMSYRAFEKDPLAFVKDQFDIQKVIKDNGKRKYNSYQVDFRSTKGHLFANFDNRGKLISSFQKFRNVKLPQEARLQILQKYRDAVILDNRYIASSKGWEIQKEYYKVKIKDGDKTRRLKINKEKDALTLVVL